MKTATDKHMRCTKHKVSVIYILTGIFVIQIPLSSIKKNAGLYFEKNKCF